MPNKTVADAPSTLPMAAKRIFVAALNAAYEGTCNGDDKCAHKVAWGAVKKKYKQDASGDWVTKSEAGDTMEDSSAAPIENFPTEVQGSSHEDRPSIAQLSMFITKATTNDQGVRRWTASASDTAMDSYNTRMSRSLFESFIRHINNNDPVPPEFQSEVWKGGAPYLGVAHYDDLDGLGIVGPSTTTKLDGDVLKAQGTFENPRNPSLVDAAFMSIRSDIEKRIPDDRRIRISIGFLDWQHAHGANVFTRKSVTDVCPVCRAGHRPDVYLEGQIIHYALTRVPVNERTSITAWEERSQTVATRIEDAASIVGDEEAKKLEELSKGVQTRSEAVVSLSEATEPEVVKSDMMDADEMGASSSQMDGYYGGALTIADALTWVQAQQEAQRLNDLWYVFSDVMCNILCATPEQVPDKAAAIKTAVDDFKGQIESGTQVMMARIDRALTRLETTVGDVTMADETTIVQPTPHPLDGALTTFRAAYDEAIHSGGTRQERLQKLQPAVNALGQAVLRSVDEQPVVPADIADIVSRVLDEKLKALLPAKEVPAQPAVEQSTTRPAPALKQAAVARAASTPVASRQYAKVTDIVAATVK